MLQKFGWLSTFSLEKFKGSLVLRFKGLIKLLKTTAKIYNFFYIGIVEFQYSGIRQENSIDYSLEYTFALV